MMDTFRLSAHPEHRHPDREHGRARPRVGEPVRLAPEDDRDRATQVHVGVERVRVHAGRQQHETPAREVLAHGGAGARPRPAR